MEYKNILKYDFRHGKAILDGRGRTFRVFSLYILCGMRARVSRPSKLASLGNMIHAAR